MAEAGTKPPGQQGLPQLPRGCQGVRGFPQGVVGSVVASYVILQPLCTHKPAPMSLQSCGHCKLGEGPSVWKAEHDPGGLCRHSCFGVF